MGEDQKTLEYQETMKLDVENISRNKKLNEYQYIRLFMLHFLQLFFPPEFSEKCKNNPNEPQILPSEVKVALRTKWLCDKGYMHKW